MQSKFNLAALAMAAFCATQAIAVGPLGTSFTYQGRLNDSGQPANGNYDLSFNLMDAATSGNQVGPTVSAINVPLHDGYFVVELDFGPTVFEGASRWLQIGIRTNSGGVPAFTQLSPRQPVRPTPQAFYAVKAGQATAADIASSVAWANVTGVPAGLADQVDNDTTYSAGVGLDLSAGNQFNVTFGANGAANSAARSDHDHFGARWTGSISGTGLAVTNTGSSPGLYGRQGAGAGVNHLSGVSAGVWGEAITGDGVFGETSSSNGRGVSGLAVSKSGTTAGVSGQADADAGVGVRGLASSGTGVTIGVRGEAFSASGFGILARNDAGVALKAAGTGVIQSDADSYIILPGSALVTLTSGSDLGYSLGNGDILRLIYNGPTTGDTVVMPLTIPTVLYGQKVTLKEVTIFYDCEDGTKSFINRTTITKISGSMAVTFPIDDFTPHTSNTPSQYTLFPNIQMDNSGMCLSLRIGVTMDTISGIRISAIRLRLGHT
jgi:hypothetical protein